MRIEDQMELAGSYAEGKLLAGRIGNVGIVLFNQPEKRNAVSLEMWEGVCAALDLFGAAEDIRVVVYAGSGGKAFTSGGDISQYAERRNSAEANSEYNRIAAKGREKMGALAKPSIACIDGFCLGGGLSIALLADLRVAAPDSMFGVPAARLGLCYSAEAMERLVTLIGPARARLMIYTARRINASEAFAMGLVDVIAGKDAASETLELAITIADNAPLSVAAAKFFIDQVQKQPKERDEARMLEHMSRCMDSSDYREGRSAFMEKRKPAFLGA
ncbi:enoyl-CoA hydratase [Variovorax sp. Sphag1AA]|uniref:enoyl-CoA hydratase n=1 Tax=Variovorax sp. Sphag1AA TaxID=2587027 RepID=UPI0016127C09|nr:enoyl-CoA hydratase [Variovorax sp. Sphag1AA]MBB3181141.1 enoyl-CoA hydratase/carnithine racemase [Variovorax sp. Sphag1AA]